ncbi:MAG: ABC transporter permease [Deltaproteobacteria bacterium]|nr:MAG: ABC transporter permease [Deltaproteobacteria bacterium]
MNVKTRSGGVVKETLKKLTQEQVILLVTVVFVVLFSVFIKGFASTDNLMILLRNMSALGIFSIGMGIVVIGRGIDLSQVTTGAVSAAWVLKLMQDGMGITGAILLGLALVLLVGAINGYLIAFIEIPSLFATLASGICVYGFVRHFLLKLLNNHYVPKTCEAFLFIGQGKIWGIPMPVIWFGLISLFAHLFLSRTSYGRFIYAQGDNEDAARMTGIGVRPMKVLQYVLCALIGYFAAIIMASSTGSLNVRIVGSTLIFDVVLVVVLGGISLVGGRGSVLSVLVGTALIGSLLNGMVLINLGIAQQNLVKSVVLLGAILLDTFLHPRDEETARQGDI